MSLFSVDRDVKTDSITKKDKAKIKVELINLTRTEYIDNSNTTDLFSNKMTIKLKELKYCYKYENNRYVDVISINLNRKNIDSTQITIRDLIKKCTPYIHRHTLEFYKDKVENIYISENQKTLYIIEEDAKPFITIRETFNSKIKEKIDAFLKTKNKLLPEIKEKIALFAVPHQINIYKIFYEFKDSNNPNRGFKCIYKDILQTPISDTRNDKLILFQKSKLSNITTIKYFSNEEQNKSFDVQPNDNFIKLLQVVDLKTFDYNNLYISEDETILYYIEDNYIEDFNVLNESFLEVLDKMPNIEYSTKLSTENQSDYYTITLNNNLKLSELDFTAYPIISCKYNIQLFNLKTTQIIKKERKANKKFNLDGDLNNWYFISTTLKNNNKKSRNILELRPLKNGNNIIQLIYISPEKINEYNLKFAELRMPIRFEIIPKIKSLVVSQATSPQYPPIRRSTGRSTSQQILQQILQPTLPPQYPPIKASTGGNMKLRRLLKSY